MSASPAMSIPLKPACLFWPQATSSFMLPLPDEIVCLVVVPHLYPGVTRDFVPCFSEVFKRVEILRVSPTALTGTPLLERLEPGLWNRRIPEDVQVEEVEPHSQAVTFLHGIWLGYLWDKVEDAVRIAVNHRLTLVALRPVQPPDTGVVLDALVKP